MESVAKAAISKFPCFNKHRALFTKPLHALQSCPLKGRETGIPWKTRVTSKLVGFQKKTGPQKDVRNRGDGFKEPLIVSGYESVEKREDKGDIVARALRWPIKLVRRACEMAVITKGLPVPTPPTKKRGATTIRGKWGPLVDEMALVGGSHARSRSKIQGGKGGGDGGEGEGDVVIQLPRIDTSSPGKSSK